MPNDTQPLVAMTAIRKAFSGVEVLRGVDFTLRAGEVHALVGENGAGKSTLIKILCGAHSDYSGVIRLVGRPVRPTTPQAAADEGIAVIHQELSLVPQLSAAENIFLGREPRAAGPLLAGAEMRRRARALLQECLGLDIDVRRAVSDLPIALQQMVEIGKVLARDARIIIMDEPTSALSDTETERLFDVVRQLRAAGIGIIYISHKMDEIYALADRITVLRDGELVGTAPAADLPLDQLVSWMVGRTIDRFFPPRAPDIGDVVLRVRDVWLREPGGHHWAVRGAGFDLRRGEVLGIAGLVGSGNSELLGAIYGRYGTPARGAVDIVGAPFSRPSPRAALQRGMALLTNDRKASGLVLPMSALHNMSLATLPQLTRAGLLSGSRERRACAPYLARLSIRAAQWLGPVATLSGGNQQKVLLSRWLLTGPRVLLLDEPTRGVDVAAKTDIYHLLNELTAAGLGIVLISSELPELLALSDRVLVMHRGRVQAEFARRDATQETVMRAALGT